MLHLCTGSSSGGRQADGSWVGQGPQSVLWGRLAWLGYWAGVLLLSLLLQRKLVAGHHALKVKDGRQGEPQGVAQGETGKQDNGQQGRQGMEGEVVHGARGAAHGPRNFGQQNTNLTSSLFAAPTPLSGLALTPPSVQAPTPPSGQAHRGWQVPLIIVRKGYHAAALALLLPVLVCDPLMLSVSGGGGGGRGGGTTGGLLCIGIFHTAPEMQTRATTGWEGGRRGTMQISCIACTSGIVAAGQVLCFCPNCSRMEKQSCLGALVIENPYNTRLVGTPLINPRWLGQSQT